MSTKLVEPMKILAAVFTDMVTTDIVSASMLG
jgi:hypothetical protein